MKKLIELIKKVPWWGYIYAASLILFQIGIYFIMGKVNSSRIDLINSVDVKIPAIDDKIPFIVNSAIFYFLSYPYWVLAAIVISTSSKKNVINFAFGYCTAIVIGLFFFIFMPTYLDREAEGVIQAVSNPGLMNWLLRFIYNNDGGNIGTNLFPSFHCLITTYECLCVLFEKNIRRGWKGFSVIAVVLICTATVTTKQHYFIDVVGGVGLALIMFTITHFINPSRFFKNK